MPLRFVRALAIQIAGSGFNALVSLALMLVLGRMLGATDFGHYVAVLSLAVVLLIPIEGGWAVRVYRESVTPASATHDADLAANALAHISAVALTTAAGAWLLAPAATATATALLCMGTVAAMNLVSARLRAAARFGREAAWQVGGRTLSALAIVGALALGARDPAWLFLAWMVGLLPLLMAMAGGLLPRPRWAGWSATLWATGPFLLIEGVLTLMLKGDVAVLGALGAADRTLSYYAACTRFNEAALLLFAPLQNVLLRWLRLHHLDMPAFARLWRGGVAAAGALGLAVLTAATVAGDRLMPLLFGGDYAGAGELLRYTALMLPFSLANLVMAQALIARNGESRLAVILPIAALGQIGAMWAGWHSADAHGAAIGAAAMQALLAIALFALLSRPRAESAA